MALPLAGAVICWTFGPQLRAMAGWLVSGLVGASFVLAVLSWHDGTQRPPARSARTSRSFSWMPGFDFGLLARSALAAVDVHHHRRRILDRLLFDRLHAGRRAFARFFAYMSFFVFAMLTLVLSDNFVGLLVGWGLVGLASYFLIGFWFERPTAVAAARKAFVINVVGDVGVMFAIFVIIANVHSIGFGAAFARCRHVRHGHRSYDLHRALHRRGCQVGTGAVAHLAARRNGGPDARSRR